jgi:Mycoplasma protein of unknown function, DUF285
MFGSTNALSIVVLCASHPITLQFYDSPFAGNLGSWDVSNLENAALMFELALEFNSNIAGWNVVKLTGLIQTFLLAASFNQDLCPWQLKLPEDATFGSAFDGTSCPELSDPVSVSSGPYCHVCPPLLMGISDATVPDLEPNQAALHDTSVPTITSSAADKTPSPTQSPAPKKTPTPTESPASDETPSPTSTKDPSPKETPLPTTKSPKNTANPTRNPSAKPTIDG